ncbi:glycosyltransferase family 39 protein [Saccharopolyspora shandongensis]|uniref:glycosyltransferase family 39 protein n=1 Tax=Saccharopolyspora shandongensis TaxID=418495 RepID=UPI003422A798
MHHGFGFFAATAAARALVLTSLSVALNRRNNPDTSLVLLSLALWAPTPCALTNSPMLWAAVAVGLAFNTKMLQGAYFVLPVIALGYLCGLPAGPAYTYVHNGQ